MKFIVLNTHLTVQITFFWVKINWFFFRWRARFISNALLIFRSGSKSGDYHDDINHANYMKWLQEKLIPNLESKSVIVVDNASYHNVVDYIVTVSFWYILYCVCFHLYCGCFKERECACACVCGGGFNLFITQHAPLHSNITCFT